MAIPLCLRNRVRVWNYALVRTDVYINPELSCLFFSLYYHVLRFRIQNSWTQPYGFPLFQKAYHHKRCLCVPLFKNMSKMRDEHWNNDMLLHLSRSSFPKWRPAKCMCLRSSSSKASRRMGWSEEAHTTCSIFRGLLFQKDEPLFHVFATTPSQKAIGRIAMSRAR